MEGEYVGMRRFTRILERGPEAKAAVDAVADACGTLINLRTSIMRYRRPKSVQRFYRPEIQARHSAFQRGSAYLERYCMLVAFAVYLQQCAARGRRHSFAEWLAARPDVVQAREALHLNPAGALAPVPAAFPPTPAAALAGGGGTPAPRTAGRDVPIEEQRRVLLRRKGSTVGRRSILKSFTVPGGRRGSDPGGGGASPSPPVPGVVDMRQARGLPVYAVGSATVGGLRRLLGALGATPGGGAHVVVTDLREELVRGLLRVPGLCGLGCFRFGFVMRGRLGFQGCAGRLWVRVCSSVVLRGCPSSINPGGGAVLEASTCIRFCWPFQLPQLSTHLLLDMLEKEIFSQL